MSPTIHDMIAIVPAVIYLTVIIGVCWSTHVQRRVVFRALDDVHKTQSMLMAGVTKTIFNLHVFAARAGVLTEEEFGSFQVLLRQQDETRKEGH